MAVPDPVEPVVPKVDARYWFNYSEGIVTKALDGRDQAAAKIQNLVIWLWLVYTTYTAVGFALSTKQIPAGIKVMIALTSMALVGVYWVTVWVQMPIVVRFDPRSPTDIAAAYTMALRSKAKRLEITLILSLVAAASLVVSLILSGTSQETVSPRPSLKAELGTAPDGHTEVNVTAQLAKVDTAKLCIRSTPKYWWPPPAAPDGSVICGSYKPSDSGLLQVSVPTKVVSPTLQVVVTWQDKVGTTLTLAPSVTPGDGTSAKVPSAAPSAVTQGPHTQQG